MVPNLLFSQYIDGVYSQQLRGLALEFTVIPCSRSPLWKKPDRAVLRARKGADRVGNTPCTRVISKYVCTLSLQIFCYLSGGSSTRLPGHFSSNLCGTILPTVICPAAPKKGAKMEVDVKGAAHCSFDRCPGLRPLQWFGYGCQKGQHFGPIGNPQCLFRIRSY